MGRAVCESRLAEAGKHHCALTLRVLLGIYKKKAFIVCAKLTHLMIFDDDDDD
jgi:hypothetical protein